MTKGDIISFWKELQSSERSVPYVVVCGSNTETDGEWKFPVSIQRLASILFGNAVVFYTDSEECNKELQRILPKMYSCRPGAIRTYLPNLIPDNAEDSFRHRFLKKQLMAELGEDVVIGIFCDTFVQNVNPFEKYLTLTQCKKEKREYEQRVKLTQLREEHNDHISILKTKNDQLAEESLSMEEKYLEAGSRVVELESQLKSVQEENAKLENCRSELQCWILKYKKLSKEKAGDFPLAAIPANKEEVVEYFKNNFSDRMYFGPDFSNSLKGCIIPPVEMWKAFYGIVTVSYDCFIKSKPQQEKMFYSLTGLTVGRGEGSQTRKDKNMMRNFKINPGSRNEINIEKHIKFNKIDQSIHFGFDAEKKKVVIATCGKHLTNYSTKKHNASS